MSNKLDDLFRAKLADHTITPSAEAWSRVAAGQAKKNNVWWWRAAAAVAALTVIVIGAQQWSADPVTPVAVAPTQVTTKPDTTPATVPAIVPPIVSNQQSVVAQLPVNRPAVQQPVQQVVTSFQAEVVEESLTVVSETVVVEEVATQTVVDTTEPTQGQLVLVYSLETIEETAHDTIVSKPGALQRVASFARDLKNGESTVGLREIKEELFALNFRKKENRKQ